MCGVNNSTVTAIDYDLEGQIIPYHLAITAMRDSGYKNTAYALAELIDNAQQANAKDIEVFCLEEEKIIEQRKRSRVSRIAVLDNGVGMNIQALRMALQFGNGTRLNDRSGIGRFGMGLPNASISQAGRVDVWSWQNGLDNAIHTYLDIDDIRAGILKLIPNPSHCPVPNEWRYLSDNTGKTGSLVIWSKLDSHRLTWKTAKSTLHNTEQIVGRIYRKFLSNGSLSIRMVAKHEDGDIFFDQKAHVVDPLYLIPSPLVPDPFKGEAMFELIFDDPIYFDIEYEGERHKVSVRFSVAKTETVEYAGTKNRGDTKYGHHAKHNIGVSVVRAGRELMLDPGWCIGYDPRERWWGAEVEFPPALDEVFGVTNNKQAATHFSELAKIQWEQLAENGESFIDVVRRLKEEGDPRGWLLELSDGLQRNLQAVRKVISGQGSGKRSTRKQRHNEVDNLTKAINDSWKNRSKECPIEGEDVKPSDDVLLDIKNDLTKGKNYSEIEAKDLIELIREKDLKVIFLEANFADRYNLFNVETKGSVTEITFNRQHPAFNDVFGTVNTIDEDINGLTKEEILERLGRAINASKIIFAAWARYERESGIDRARALEKVRHDWGQIAATFLECENELSL